jgi:hypothetical protein
LNTSLILDYPWYALLLCLLAGLVYASITYFRSKKNTDWPKGLLMGVTLLRFVSVTLTALLLLNIFIKRLINETSQPIVIFAKDNSASIVMSKDSSRLKKELNTIYNQLKKNLQSKYDVKSILFGSEAITSDTCTFKEKETDFDKLFASIDNNYANQNIGALIIASDGIYNRGSNPAFQAEKLNFPIYTIALGDTTITKDIALQKINHNQVAYLGNQFPAELIINATRLKGKPAKVSISQAGSVKASQNITITSDNFNQTLSFLLNAENSGVQRYDVSISVLEEESNKINNYQSFVIEVIDNREKILFIANYPHPDIAAIKESIESTKTYEVELMYFNGTDKPVKPYSLVMIHGYSVANINMINACKTNLTPYFIINPQSFEQLQSVRISNSFNKQNDAEPTTNSTFGAFNLSAELKNAIKEWPAVKVPFGNYQIANGALVLLSQKVGIVETENPVWLFQEMNAQKSALFLGDGLWRWKMRDFSDHENFNLFNELISKTVQYLSVKADKSFFRVFTKKIVNENESVEFDAEVYNKSYEPITEPEVSLRLTNENKQVFNYTFSKTNTAYKLNIGLLPSGDYRYEAKTNANGSTLIKQGLLTVKPILAEQINTVANHKVLFDLSQKSGGKLVSLQQTQELEKLILSNELIKPITYSSKQTTDIIHFKWLFFMLLFLLAAEWFLRKRNGSV